MLLAAFIGHRSLTQVTSNLKQISTLTLEEIEEENVTSGVSDQSPFHKRKSFFVL